jgi:hypothetical protein
MRYGHSFITAPPQTGHGGGVNDAVEVLAADVARGQRGLAESGVLIVGRIR